MTIQSISHSTLSKSVEQTNILFRLQALVCKINTQLSRLSQETQSRSQTMKKEYRIATDKSADLTKKVGNLAPIVSAFALASSGIGIGSSAYFGESAKRFENTFSLIPRLVEAFGQLGSSHYNAEIGQAGSVSSLRQTEIQNEAGKSGEARDLQSEIQQLLANIRELYKKASG